MIKNVFFLAIILITLQAWSNQIKVLQVVSQPEVTVAENRKLKIIKNSVLKDLSHFKTGANQFVKIQLGSFYELSILDQTEVFVEQKISTGQLISYEVKFIEGQIYLQKLSKIKKNELDQTAELKLHSAFFDWKLSNELNMDLMIELQKNEPRIRFCNRVGEFQVSLFDHEKKIVLKSLESVEFKGVNEVGVVAFDILLNGRKIPKGHWQEPQKCSFEEIMKKESEFTKLEQIETQKQQQKVRKNRIDKQKADDRFLCHNPYGQLNECSFVLRSGRCQKARCNAEGKWTSSELISIAEAPECTVKPFVAQCNN